MSNNTEQANASPISVVSILSQLTGLSADDQRLKDAAYNVYFNRMSLSDVLSQLGV